MKITALMLHRSLIGLLFVSAAFCRCYAQSTEEIVLRQLAPSNDAPLTEEISYRRNHLDDRGFNRVITKVAQPTLTVYHPAKKSHRGTAIIICPGGGYQYVVIDREGHLLARYFQQRGITAVVLKYRLPQPEVTGACLPLPQQDALEAIQQVHRKAEEWGLDPNRIGILGCSAGGHLAGSVAVLGDKNAGTRPDFVALLYPVVTLEPPYAHEGSRKYLLGGAVSSDQIQKYSLEQNAVRGMPPFFLVHARDDTAVACQNSEMLAGALQAEDVPTELLLVESGGHGFSLGRGPETDRWKDAFLSWLDRLP